VRVNDIIAEVQKAVTTLERQARRAGQYNEVRDRLKAMEIDLMEREFAHLRSRTIPLNERLEALRGERVQIDGTLSRDEERLEQLRSGIREKEQQLAEAQRDVSLQREKLGVVMQTTLVATERRKGLEETIGRCSAEIGSLGQESAELEAGKESLRARILEYNQAEDQASRDLTEAQEVLAVVEHKLSEKRVEMQDLSDRTIVLVQTIAEQQGEQDRKRARMENLQGRFGRAQEEIQGYGTEITRLDEEIGRLREEDKRLRRLFTEAEMKYYEAEK
jgi:chromosome segregation protein